MMQLTFNPDTVPDDEIVKRMGEVAAELVPVGDISHADQMNRATMWPFVFYQWARRLQSIIIEKDMKINQQRNELIEVRKELSALKKRKQ
jgi:hypothetical protein